MTSVQPVRGVLAFAAVWVVACASSSPALAGPCPGAGDCCAPGGNGSPGCDDEICCNQICAIDPFCCDVMWDGICADEANAMCAACIGDVPEACCFAGGSCKMLLPPDCAAAGGEAQGPGTLCVPNPCIGPCTIECVNNEGEACTDGLVPDNVNGGCNSTPPVFGAVECGQTICGLAWAVNGTRDTDWYLTEVVESGTFLSAALVSEFQGVVFIVDGIAACAPVVVGQTGDSANCVPGLPAEAILDAGQYVVFVATAAFDGTPCGSGNVYAVEVTASPCVIPEEDCGVPGSGDCCAPNNTPGCDEVFCCEYVCSIDPACCLTGWDALCASLAAETCDECGGVTVGCCSPGGFGCINTTPDLCAALGGEVIGESCDPAICPAFGGCCLGDTGCEILTEGECADIGGIYAGDGSDCLDEDGNGLVDMCEIVEGEECNCLSGDCSGTGEKEEITNLKKPQIGIVDRNQRLGKRILEKNSDTMVVPVRSVKEAITAICKKHEDAGMKINIVVDGHGSPGHQHFGKERIGHGDKAAEKNQKLFEKALKGKVKHLQLMGCETGKGDDGQAFLKKLREATGAELVKAWTGVVEKQVPPNKFFVVDGEKVDVVAPTCPGDTNGDGTVDVVDLTTVILAWGTSDPDADVSGDGVVSVEDLTLVILNWGECE